MLNLLLGKTTVYIIIGIFASALVGAAYFYYTSSQNAIRELTAANATLVVENANLKEANASIQATLETVRNSAKVQMQLAADLNVRLNQSEVELNNLRTLLIDHDLTMLSLQKPALIERRINDATRNIFDTLTSDTSN